MFYLFAFFFLNVVFFSWSLAWSSSWFRASFFFFKLFFCYKYQPLCNFYLTGIRHALCSSAFLCEFSALAIRKVAFYFHHSNGNEISAKKRQLQKLEMRTMLIVCGKHIKSGNGRTDKLRRVSGYRDVLLLNICFKVFIRIKRMSLFPLIDCLFSPRRLIANIHQECLTTGCFSLKFCNFSELCQICCGADFLPAWCVYTH